MVGSGKKREVSIPDLSWIESVVLQAEPPGDAVTSSDVARMTGLCRRAAEDRLKKGVDQGSLETGLFMVESKQRRYYWPKK